MRYSCLPTLMTLLMLLPASSRMAFMPSQDALVLSPMLPSTRLPFLSAGIWPETKICPLTLMAWLYILAIRVCMVEGSRESRRQGQRAIQTMMGAKVAHT